MAEQAAFPEKRIEDVFQDEIIKAFANITSFKKFSRSKNGLCLDESYIKKIVEDYRSNVQKQMMEILLKWREIQGENATVREIRHLLLMYFRKDIPSEYIVLENGIFGVYKTGVLSKSSNVYLGVQTSEVDGIQTRAIKFVPRNERRLREAQFWSKLGNHVNVVSIIHVGIHHAEPQDYIYIAMEYSWTQTVRNMLNLGKPFHEFSAWSLVKQLMGAVEFIHSYKFIHKNLEPENILASDDWRHFKVTGFGLSRNIVFETNKTNVSNFHLEGYRACETYHYDYKITRKVDIFAAGVIIGEIMANGRHPFGEDPVLWAYNITNDKNLDLSHLCVSNKDQAVSLIKRMLEMDPEKRPTAGEVLNEVTIYLQTLQLRNNQTTADELLTTTSTAIIEQSITNKGIRAIVPTIRHFFQDIFRKDNPSGQTAISDQPLATTSKATTELSITEKVWTGSTAVESLATPSITKKGWKQIEGTDIEYDQASRYRKGSEVFDAIRKSGGEDQEAVVKFVTDLDIEDEEIMKKIQREIDNHWTTHTHKNVVKYFDSGHCKYEEKNAIFILMEKCDKKTLYERIKEKNLPYIERAETVKCIAQGLHHLKKRNILHRDLKPQNILYKDDVDVISDFGLSKTISSNKSYTFQSSKILGTAGWGAPETYSDNAKSSFAADIYSAGLVFYFALTNGKHPYGDNPIFWQTYIITDKNEEKCELKALHDTPNGKVAYELISLMLSRDPKDRPTIEEVLKHPFFWGVEEKKKFYDDICRTIEYHGEKITGSRIFSSQSAKYLNEVETEKKDWKDKLLLTDAEKKTIEDNFGRRGFDITVEKDVMKGFAKKLHDSVTSMVCFIRNRFTHSVEDRRDQKIDLTNEELWEFFDSKYPCLFIYTYYASKEYYETIPASDPDYLKKYF